MNRLDDIGPSPVDEALYRRVWDETAKYIGANAFEGYLARAAHMGAIACWFDPTTWAFCVQLPGTIDAVRTTVRVRPSL